MATNEELAMLVKSGNQTAVLPLWQQTKGFIAQQAIRWISKHEGVPIETEDLIQSGFFALIKAVKYYDPDKGLSFITYLTRPLKTVFKAAAGVMASSEKQYRGKLGLLSAASLDAPLGDGSDEEYTQLSQLADSFDLEGSVTGRDYKQRLHRALQKALTLSLTPREQQVIEVLYFTDGPGKALDFQRSAELLHLDADEVKRLHSKALDKLRTSATAAELRELWYAEKPLRFMAQDAETLAISASGLSSFRNRRSSSTELAAELLIAQAQCSMV